MSLADIKTQTKFGATVGFTDEEIARSNFKVVPYKLERQAESLGILIMKEKGWIEDTLPNEHIKTFTRTLYVFTPSEMRDFMDAKFKARLQEMAATESWLTEEQRHALMVQSERF